MKMNAQRSWVSPFTAVTFAAVAITGLMMLFHIKSSGIHQLHQWGGLALIIFGAVHLFLNWQVFLSYFRTSKAIWGTLAGAMLLFLILVMAPANDHGGRSHQDISNRTNYETRHHR